MLISPVRRFKPTQLAFRAERRLGIPLGMSRYEATFLRKHAVDLIFTLYDLGPWFNLPLLAWLPDFQHVHLPEMFSAAEFKVRDRAYQRTAQWSSRVILGSKSGLEDFQRFAPEFAAKGRVIHFTAQVSASVYDSDPSWVCEQYDLPERFVYLPNQFWRHKNHQLVVEALGLLKAQAKATGVTIVCSGSTSDFRNPDYFPELQARIEQLGIQDKFLILGMIPHDHIFQLMRQSLAVLQPSLFEGWSTSVEETKSIGKRIVLSDLAVHREQDPPAALFFDPHDPQALADGLVKTFEEASPGPDLALELHAREQLPHRTKTFGEAFMQVAREIVSG